MAAWLSALAFLVVSSLVGVSMLGAARILRVRARHTSTLKERTYECGEAPESMAWMQFHARYYVVALFFVLFDVEAVMLGWLYALRKEALRWQ
jgi:NADH-quinone oxidoreductase subunit A